jgi:hypothetical protein
MNGSTVTIEIPGPLFQRLQTVANFMHRPVEELVAQTLDVVSAPPHDIPSELAAELNAMLNFSDDALWAATRPVISPAERARLEQLNALAGERELSAAETQERTELLSVWQRALARRARAFSILKLRGHPLPAPDKLKASIEETA